MTFSLGTFLIVCPLVFLGGFVDAVAGGGGLISLPAYMIAGLPPVVALGTNKLSSAMGTTLTTVKFARDGFIPWKKAPVCVICAFIGSAIGANLAMKMDNGIFKILMIVILPLTAVYVAKSKTFIKEKTPYPFGKTLLIAALTALGIGMYDGFYGPGAGTFLILMLTALAHMSVYDANGMAKIINISTNLTAVAVYIMNGKTIFSLGLIAGVFGIAGNYFGARAFEKGGSRSVQPIMIAVLAVFFVKILYEFITA